MHRLFFFIFFFIVLLVEGVEAAVDVRSTRFTTTSGLGNNSVRYMYQDSKGFIWMELLTGLVVLMELLLLHSVLEKEINLHCQIIVYRKL